MECLADTLFAHNSMPEHVIFTTYQERKDGSSRIGKSHIPYIHIYMVVAAVEREKIKN